MKKIKILIVVPHLDIVNGVASYAMNYFRNIDHDRIQMDFLVVKDFPTPYYYEIKKLGGKLFIVPLMTKKPISFLKCVKNIFKEEKYDILHCHVVNTSLPFLKYAKKYNVPIRIIHSHATVSSDKKWKQIRNDFIAGFALRNANRYFACSKLAGKCLFKDRKFQVINNAVNVDKYLFDKAAREKYRKELNAEDKFVVATVGRQCEQKNPKFAMRVFAELKKICPNAVYWWIGSGEMESQLREYAKTLGISNSMFFLGNRTDINKIYSAMDTFLLPSIYEGLPVVGIEAQTASLPLIVSDTITTELKITDRIKYMSLTAPETEWAKEILKFKGLERKDMTDDIVKANYEIKKASKLLSEIYINLLK